MLAWTVPPRIGRSATGDAHGPGNCQRTTAQLPNRWKTEDGTAFLLRRKKYPYIRARVRRTSVFANATRIFSEDST